jgi:hypothetical protein
VRHCLRLAQNNEGGKNHPDVSWVEEEAQHQKTIVAGRQVIADAQYPLILI